nr:type II toxin-antitoxin system RelE/ParE family toxin [Paracidobacterium acidisoli]
MATEATESAADEFISGLEARLELLAAFPLSGSARFQLAEGLRVMIYGMYAVYYLSRDKGILLIRVLHGARDIEAIADQGGFAV